MTPFIAGRFETFQELLCHFSGAQVVPAPQLWVKCNNTQELTSGGALWEYRRGTQKIEHDEIYVVSAPRERSEYIVALAEEGDQENPVVLGEYLLYSYNNLRLATIILEFTVPDLPKCGQPGENPQVLHAYLRQRWPSHVVAHAARFSQEDDKEVLIKTFDNSTFEHRSNDLYVKCSRKSVLKTTGPSSSSSGSIHP